MQDDPATRDVHVVIPADPGAVRDALQAMFHILIERGLTELDRGTAEIVLAEVLNNVAEHAYGPERGNIEVTLQFAPQELLCQVVDSGQPMPNGTLPAGDLNLTDRHGNLAEGGFGWFLIHTLSRDLRYRREDGQNRLCFRLAWEIPGR